MKLIRFISLSRARLCVIYHSNMCVYEITYARHLIPTNIWLIYARAYQLCLLNFLCWFVRSITKSWKNTNIWRKKKKGNDFMFEYICVSFESSRSVLMLLTIDFSLLLSLLLLNHLTLNKIAVCLFLHRGNYHKLLPLSFVQLTLFKS